MIIATTIILKLHLFNNFLDDQSPGFFLYLYVTFKIHVTAQNVDLTFKSFHGFHKNRLAINERGI